MNNLEKLKDLNNNFASNPLKETEIRSFEKQNELTLPKDLIEYFSILNGTNNEYDDKFFKFYSLDHFKKIGEVYEDWKGIPKHFNIVNILPEHEKYYVFADYEINLFAYAIRLHNNIEEENEIIVSCGDEYRKIANSFSEFLDLYFEDSIELQMG